MVSALERKESRGLHFTPDYPALSKELACTVINAFEAGIELHAVFASPESLQNICKTLAAPAGRSPDVCMSIQSHQVSADPHICTSTQCRHICMFACPPSVCMSLSAEH